MQNDFWFMGNYHNYIDKNELENEDHISFQEGNEVDKLAIADGAGGVGIYCKDWSKMLVESIPDSHKELNKTWFLEISKEFFEQIIAKLPTDDLFIKEKFINQGSYATYLYTWIDKRNKKLYFSGLGDTYLFIFRKQDDFYNLNVLYPYERGPSISSNPRLINWSLEVSENDIKYEEIDLKKTDIIIACTDSIARWLLTHIYLFNPSVNLFLERISLDEIEKFKHNSSFNNLNSLLKRIIDLNCDKDFKRFIENQVDINLLEPDDFTLFAYPVQ